MSRRVGKVFTIESLTMPYLKVQVLLEKGGLEIVSDRTEAQLLQEIEDAKKENRMARFASDDPELAIGLFFPGALSGMILVPVTPQRSKQSGERHLS